jgi:hypothetical protein
VDTTIVKGVVSMFEDQKNLFHYTTQVHPRKGKEMRGLLSWLRKCKAESERMQEVDKGSGRLDRMFF